MYSMDMAMSGSGGGQKMNSEMDFDYLMEVTAESDSIKTIKTTFHNIRMKMDAGAMKVNVDTKKPPADTLSNTQNNPGALFSKMFYALKGKSFQMKVNPRGEVIGVSGVEDVRAALVSAFVNDEAMRASAEQMFSSQFNEESLKSSFSQAFSIFPDKPVVVGDSWTKKMNMGGMTPTEAQTTYKVREIKNGDVFLDISSDINAGQAKSKQTGTMQIDANTGLVEEGKMETKYAAPMDMTVTMTIKTKEQ